MKKKAKTILVVVLSLLGIAAVGYVVLAVGAAQAFTSPVLAVVSSPASEADEIWLLKWGFRDRGITLLIKSPSLNGGKPTNIARLDWPALCSFKQLDWSADGRLAVVTLGLVGEENPGVEALAFDFSTGKVFPPRTTPVTPAATMNLAGWEEHKKEIVELIQSHGGLADRTFDRSRFGDDAREIWFWQVPKR